MGLGLADLRGFADSLADTADQISLDYFGGPVPAVAKPDGSPVTEADRAVESALRARIAETHPDHAVAGEETGGTLDPTRPTWVIDPIDATANFMRGIPVYATLIAVVAEGRPVVGVASAPAMGERWHASLGGGVRRNGAVVGVSAIAHLASSQVLHGGLRYLHDDTAAWERLGVIADRCWRTRGFGDFWMHLLVAGGMAEAAFEPDLAIWDIAAVACIVTEAGGRMTGWDGGDPLRGGAVLSSNGLVHDEVRALLVGHA